MNSLQLPLPSLSIPKLEELLETSQDLRAAVQYELRKRHHRMLSHFVVNTPAFMGCLRSVGGVIGGSFALRYLQGEPGHAASDLDIYVPYPQFDEMKSYLVEAEGYVENVDELRSRRIAAHAYLSKTPGRQGDVVDEEIFRLMTMGIVEVATLRNGDRRIDILRNLSACASYAVSRSWSTVLMNYISADGYCCAYPNLTFQRVGIINPLALTQRMTPYAFVPPLVEKYVQRGYTFRMHWYTDGEDGCLGNHRNTLCPTKRRSFEDNFVYNGTFGGFGVSPRFNVQSVTSFSDWKVGWQFGGLHEPRGVREPFRAHTWHTVTGHRDRNRYVRTRLWMEEVRQEVRQEVVE